MRAKQINEFKRDKTTEDIDKTLKLGNFNISLAMLLAEIEQVNVINGKKKFYVELKMPEHPKDAAKLGEIIDFNSAKHRSAGFIYLSDNKFIWYTAISGTDYMEYVYTSVKQIMTAIIDRFFGSIQSNTNTIKNLEKNLELLKHIHNQL